jgi:hypothetical protein
VRRTHEVLLFDFELRNADGAVLPGAEPRFNAMVSLGVFRAEDGAVLWGAMIPIPICYAGTDIPWAEGRPTAICGTGVPIAKMRSTPEDGDLLRVELIEYDFQQLFLYPPASDR